MPIFDRIAGVFSAKAKAEAARHEAAEAYHRGVTAATRALMASYTGGIATRLSTPWTASDAHGVRVYKESYAQMRDRSRSLEHNNVLASSVLDRSCENVVGTGISIAPSTSSDEFNDQVSDYWDRLTSGTRFDVRGSLTWGEIQWHLYRSKLRDGDVGLLLVNGENNQPRLQIVMADQFASPGIAVNSGGIFDGVEYNTVGAPVRYYVRTPNSSYGDLSGYTPVSAADMVFLARRAYPNAVRGEPAFHDLFTLFDQIVGYLDATVVAARVAACQAMIAVKRSPAVSMGNYDAVESDVQGGGGDTRPGQSIEPGMIHYLDADAAEDIKGFNPTQPTTNFPDAIATFARFAGLRFGITIEQVLLDFSRANYSSARAARIQAEATADIEQTVFAEHCVSRVYKWAISKAINNGEITAARPSDWDRHEWIPTARPWTQPDKEIDAAIKAVNFGLDARSYITQQRGYQFVKVLRRNQKDEQMLRDAGLLRDVSPGRVTSDDMNGENEQQ